MLSVFLFGIYTVISSIMFLYGANFYYLIFRSTRNSSKPPKVAFGLPDSNDSTPNLQ